MNPIKKNRAIMISKRAFQVLVVAIIIVLAFPNKSGFKYEFALGGEWKHETLISPIDFPILKTEKEISELLHKVGLCARDYLDREINSALSGGEIKRIEIATVLARKTRISVFDEPEAGIDLWSFNNLIDVFKNLRSEKNGSIIVISHQERILSIADVIIVIGNGKVTKQGPGIMLLPEILQNSSVGKYGCPKGREIR